MDQIMPSVSNAEKSRGLGQPRRSRSSPSGSRLLRWGAVLVIGGALLAACSSSSSSSSSASKAPASKAPISITIALPVAEPVQAPVYLAKQLGYFQKAGIDASIPVLSGDVTDNSALVAGSVQFTSVNTVSLFTADEKGIPLEAACMEYDGPEWAMVVNKSLVASKGLSRNSSVKSVLEALHGQTVATVGGAAAAPGVMLSGLLQYYNLPSNWLTDLGVSSSPSLLTALGHGEVAAVFDTEPLPKEAQQQGLGTVVFDTTEIQSLASIPWEGIMGLRSYISSHPAVTKSVCTAIGEADNFILDHPAKAAADLHISLNAFPLPLIEDSLSALKWAHDATMTAAEWKNAAKQLSAFHLVASPVPASILAKAYTTADLP